MVLFFWPVLSGQRVLFYFDVTELNYPYRAFLGNELQAGRFPLWCPHLYCGFPLFAESQTGHLYPLKYLLYPWMPPWLAFGYDTVLSVWLAGLAMYAYLRRRFGPAAALAGAVPFGYGGFMAAHLIHTSYVNSMMWIPLALLAMERAWESGRSRYALNAAAALAMQILAGNMQIAILTCIALAVMAAYWLLVAASQGNGRAAIAVLATTLGACGLATALGAVQILPAKALLDRSPRHDGLAYDALTQQSSWHPELLPTILLPGAYGARSHDTDWLDGFYFYHETYIYLGITTLLLACIGATAWRRQWVFGHLVLTAVCLLFMLGRYSFVYDLFPHLPILRSMRAPVRDSVWLGLSIGSLAAAGVHRLLQAEHLNLRVPMRLFAAVAIVSAAIMLVIYYPLLRGDEQAMRLNAPPQGYPWESNRDRHQRLVRQIGGETATAAVLVAASLLLLRSVRRVPADAGRQRLALGLSLLVLIDVFWAGRHLAPTLDQHYWSRPPHTIDLLSNAPARARIYSVDNGLHNLPGYAVDRDSLRGTPLMRAGTSDPSSEAIWQSPVRHLPLSVPAAWGIDSAGGHTPIRPHRIDAFFALDHDLRYPFIAAKWQLDVAAVTHLTAPAAGPALPLSWPVSEWQTVPRPPEQPARSGAATVQLFRNPTALPRARLLDRILYASGEDAAVALFSNRRFDPREVLVVEDPAQPLAAVGTAARSDLAQPPGTARILSYQAHRVVIETEVHRPAYLFLADGYDPEWEAHVDGRPAAVRPAHVAFRAVFLQPGSHTVEFRYRPRSFLHGLLISLLALVASPALWWLGRPRVLPQIALDSRWPRPKWVRWTSSILLIAAMVLSIATHFDDWRIYTDDEGRCVGSLHTYQWEKPLR